MQDWLWAPTDPLPQMPGRVWVVVRPSTSAIDDVSASAARLAEGSAVETTLENYPLLSSESMSRIYLLKRRFRGKKKAQDWCAVILVLGGKRSEYPRIRSRYTE